MRKKLALLLLAKLSGLWQLNAVAQSQLSFEQYYNYNVGGGAPATAMPVAGFQTNNGFYAEGRYNYEELNSFSFYMGRTFSKESTLSYSISPMAGAVMGQYNGGSIAANISLGYKNFYLYSQPQYTFSLAGAENNYIYSWTDFTYSPKDWLSLGVSLQHTKPYKDRGSLQNGFVIETAIKNFTFPVYLFSPATKDRTIVFGATLELSFKKKKRQEADNKPNSFKDVFPVNIIAKAPEAESTDKSVNAAAPAENNFFKKTSEEGIVKIRRVNVVVKPKSENLETLRSLSTTKPAAQDKIGKVLAAAPAYRPAIRQTSAESVTELAKRGVSDNSGIPEKEVISTETTLYALLLGPFKSEQEALTMKLKLNETYFREIVIYSRGNEYGLRVSGFRNENEAKGFTQNMSGAEKRIAYSIIGYKLQNINAIPLKQAPEAFKATKL